MNYRFKLSAHAGFKSALAFLGVLAITGFAPADTHYVVNGNAGSASPFTDWTTAASNIQEALSEPLFLDGDTVLVSNATYFLTNSINLRYRKNNTLRSFNNNVTDPTNTIIDGYNFAGKPATNICIWVTSNSIVDGFTIRGGKTLPTGNGGGIYLNGGALTNCIVASNWAYQGGGIMVQNGVNLITDCIIRNNTGNQNGGGIYVTAVTACTITNCLISDNTVSANQISRGGGGITVPGGPCTIRNCIIRGNSCATAGEGGGLRFSSAGAFAEYCTIVSNYCAGYGGGVALVSGTLRNCLIACNYSYGAFLYPGASLANCTVTGNTNGGVRIYTGGAITNSIIYYNGDGSRNIYTNSNPDLNMMDYSCTSITNNINGVNNITSPPAFADFDNFNYQLTPNSPCINAGTNQGWMDNTVDMIGRRRIIEGTVDMGSFEFLHRGAIFKGL
ncbi:MAG: right-handed parallel beta-helix repeat-containing protein [Kiritimatiellae bacterium]|nr:right-handed parallel beta-helix repeat-containing protein [Kiritimatiellia bacterium]